MKDKWYIPTINRRITLTNLVPAISGTTGFTFKGNAGTYSAEASTAHTKYAEQSLKMLVHSDCAEMYGISNSTYPLDSSHVYYARVEAYQEVASGTMEIYFPIAEPHMFNISNKDAGNWNTYSAVCNRNTFSSGNYTFRLDFNFGESSVDIAEVWYDGLMIIDLTAAFGAGNEPDKDWCDINISFFTGTTTIDVVADSPVQTAVEGLAISEGAVMQIEDKNGSIIWDCYTARHVAFGDSIAAGHAIDENWSADYSGTQYGQNGRTETLLVPGCYVDLINQELIAKFGRRVRTTSFSRSGDKVEDLMDKLTHTRVKSVLARADYVLLCISANNVLGPFEKYLETYINTGDLEPLKTNIESNLAKLNNDADPMSFISLFNRLYEINPNATYVFTSIYNPYKYLWIDEGQNGFFAPLLATVPDMSILGFDVDSYIKDQLLKTDIVQLIFDRVNGLPVWAETFVTQLNSILVSKINSYQKPNFILAETKAIFDVFPDRPVSASKHYNDLVSVEYTRGYDTEMMNWGNLWADSNVVDFWWTLATKYVSLSGVDMNGLASDLMNQTIEKVIVPDLDPHPETFGQYVMKRAFMAALGWETFDHYTITFNANGGTGSMPAQSVIGIDGLPAFASLNAHKFTGQTGYYFTGWNTKADGTGTSYSNGQLVGINSNLVLYAQWSNIYTVTVRHSYNDRTGTHGSGDTGPMESYAIWIDGTEQADLGAFSNSARTYHLAYGTPFGVIAGVNKGANESILTWNGATIQGKTNQCAHTFYITSHTDINFEWHYWINASLTNPIQSHWNCHITTN